MGQTRGSDSQGTAQQELGQQVATAGWDGLREGDPGGLQGVEGLGEQQVPGLAPAHKEMGGGTFRRMRGWMLAQCP